MKHHIHTPPSTHLENTERRLVTAADSSSLGAWADVVNKHAESGTTGGLVAQLLVGKAEVGRTVLSTLAVGTDGEGWGSKMGIL